MENKQSLEEGNAMSLIAWAAGRLERSGVSRPRLNAELLLAHCTGMSRVELYAHSERPVPRKERESFAAAVERRAAREPLQYITGSKGFRYLDIHVDRRVLIPRPETELLAQVAIEAAAAMGGHPVVVDVGTGSGCVALSVARECPAAVVYATDISDDSLEVAHANAARQGMEDLVAFRRGDLLDALEGELLGRLDIVASNPPYIRENEFPFLPPEVREHEPYAALVAGPTGMEVHLRLMEQALSWLSPEGILFMEGGADQVERLVEEALRMGYEEARAHADLNRLPRVLEARKRRRPS
ncbi:MAG: peptide chain release factor N(5)-glutamine methyltransferase [Actinobacteria bacterium]|nr:peptide chain release factor N(5)-glutamine methyltransferase [Actinomycetota bacterium]